MKATGGQVHLRLVFEHGGDRGVVVRAGAGRSAVERSRFAALPFEDLGEVPAMLLFSTGMTVGKGGPVRGVGAHAGPVERAEGRVESTGRLVILQ